MVKNMAGMCVEIGAVVTNREVMRKVLRKQ
jgi:hypothetical protein